MTVVVYELNDENEFEELGRSYNDGQTDEALLGIYPEEVWEEESDKWLVERLDGPYVIGEIVDDEVDKRLEKFWTEYVGPEGGEGWQNLLTGEVRYQDPKPTTDDEYDHGEDVREPDSDSAFTNYGGISDGSHIRDNMPVTAKFSDEEGEAHYGEIVRADIGGFRDEFVIAAANGSHYHVEEDNIEGFIEPRPEWDPANDNEDRMWQNQFEGVKEELGEDTIPDVPTRDMGNGGDPPDTGEFNHIGDGKLTDEHVRILQNTIETGELGPLSVDFAATGDDVDHEPWDTDITDWHNGGQFAHVDTEMPVEDFLATQATMLADHRDHPTQAHRSFFGSARPGDVKEYAEVLQEEPGEMPMPYIEIGKHGRLRNYQEGRHRALAAMYAGHDTIPVRMVVNAEREGTHEDDTVQWPRSHEKAWIPYEGPRGGTGWRNTTNERIRYVEEKPEAKPADPDELTEEAVEHADIQQSWGLLETTADSLQDGDPLAYYDGEYQWDLRVQEVGEDHIDAISPETQREVTIPTDRFGEPEGEDAAFRKPQAVFIGDGIAASESSWLPDDEDAEVTDLQLEAEALRSAASTDGMGDTSYLEAFAARTQQRDIDRDRAIDALEAALDKHPTLFSDQAGEIYENGERLLEITESLREEKLLEAAESVESVVTFRKGWIPYQGPQGGEGWQSADNPTDVRYQEDPPGEIQPGYEDMAEGWGSDESNRPDPDVEIPERFADEYGPEDITPIESDPAEWDGQFPFSPGQTLLGENWEWEIDDAWFRNDKWTEGDEALPAFRAALHNGVTHEFAYMDGEKVEALGLDPGWYQWRSSNSPPDEDDYTEFVGVVGEPEAYEFGFDPDPEVAAANDFDMEAAASEVADAVGEDRWDNSAANERAADIIAEHDPTYGGLLEIVEHALESNGESVNHDRDINDAEEIALDAVKLHLHRQAEDHSLLDGKLSLGDVDDELRQDFQTRMTTETRNEVSNVMGAWVRGYGSMVDEITIPVYSLADDEYENDFYPTRDDPQEAIEAADDLEERKERMDLYRQKTVETFREQFGDTIPVFRGYNPEDHNKGEEAREALQSEDGPSQIEIRNGVANSWSTDPTVAYKFSQWTNDDESGVVVRQELPVEQIFGASDTATDLMGHEAEIIAGNPEEVAVHGRDDVFLPEEFDALEQAKWALDVVEGETGQEDEKADGDTLRLDRDWELNSVGWMNTYRRLSDVLLSKNWMPVDTDDEYAYQHIDSGEMVVSKNVEFSMTAARAGYRPAQEIVAKGRLSKKWIPYRGPQGGEGWQNVNYPDDIRYQEDPPGEILDGYEEYAEGWGDYDPDERDRVQGAEIIDYNVPGTDKDLQIPRNFDRVDIAQTAEKVHVGKGDAQEPLRKLVDIEMSQGNYDHAEGTDWVRATAQVLEMYPEAIDEFNEELHTHIRDNPHADFDTPFGMDGPEAHDLLEDTFGRYSDIVSDLEDSILFDDSVNEENAEAWVVGAQEWIRNNGDRKMADEFKEALNAKKAENPFVGVKADVPDHMDPAKAETVTPISDTEADTGISAESMFIAEFEDGSRAFVTNTSWDRMNELDGVGSESKVDAQRAMAGYEAFKVADMDVPRHEHVEDEYWTVEEAPGQPAKEWSGNPAQIDREQFYKLGAVGMLSGNWDLHGGNVFVTDEGDLIPVDLDLSGHMIVDDYHRSTAWGRLKRLGDKLDLFDRIDSDAVERMKYEVARKTKELVEDGTADDIKSMASNIEHGGIQMNIEENVFAAKDGRLYDDETWEKPEPSNSERPEDAPDGIMGEMHDEFQNLGGDDE